VSKYEFIQHLYEGEECRELGEYPGYYVTTHARLWNSNKGRWMKQRKHKGVDKRRVKQTDRYYWLVTLCNREGKWKTTRIHTLVGRAFIPEYREGLFILHKEETLPYPQINYLENLWVGNNSDNMKDMWSKGRRERRYAEYSIEGKVYTRPQLTEVALQYNLKLNGVISRIQNNNYPTWHRR